MDCSVCNKPVKGLCIRIISNRFNGVIHSECFIDKLDELCLYDDLVITDVYFVETEDGHLLKHCGSIFEIFEWV